MSLHVLSSVPCDRKRQPHRPTIEVQARIRSKENVARYFRMLRIARNKLQRALYTIEEGEMDEMPGAPRVTIRKRPMKEAPVVKKSPTFRRAISKKRQHRRFKAMDEDDFSKITMVCEDLHASWARSHTRSPTIWNH
ncbi:hypothetical protein FisN_7Hu325 [Fistulifera solaris]|uniref:Uncharacterized protein n=1 Tax=Fistulifera solaris TaxID=1519565 RepID=A0A1Z5KSW0_FISSO|nr:hypothetical protein FisN_7Hu325 [Fistulifera solaris]|eukprot:GAX29081.1 hypothetical protein FisN_7Hu325 [Fistulifera solaris]